jgi:hypothetical protein
MVTPLTVAVSLCSKKPKSESHSRALDYITSVRHNVEQTMKLYPGNRHMPSERTHRRHHG